MARRHLNASNRSTNLSSQSSQRSNNTASSEVSDFLGRFPSHIGSTSSTATTSSTSSRPPNQQKKQTRKQVRPKKLSPAMKEIINLQQTTHLLIPRLPFQRVIREILQQNRVDFRVQRLAIDALRESSEMYLVQMFSDALLCMIHARRVTLQIRDIHLLKALAEPQNI